MENSGAVQLRTSAGKTVAVDAMGGDHHPQVEVAGAVAAVRTGRVRVVLVGDETTLRRELRRHPGTAHLPIDIRHASQVISMNDHASSAVRRKTDASMRIAADMVRDGRADALVSAGNSGAMMACGLLVLKRLAGVDRPAILTNVPTGDGHVAILDVGANVECRPLNLVQFALMGQCFARLVHGKSRPTVGVLSNGAEPHKGTELTRECHARLEALNSPEFDYLGYVEGGDIFTGRADVVVCDGFCGNVVLKVTEAATGALVDLLKYQIKRRLLSRLLALGLLPAVRRARAQVDYAEQGGAPLLGVDGVAIICHGGSNAKAIKNAVLCGADHAEYRLSEAIRTSVAVHAGLASAGSEGG